MTTATLPSSLTYTPGVVSVSPATVPLEGTVSITITGVGFTGATSVAVGGVAATDVVVVNDTTITCTVPAHVAGSADVIVVVAGIDGTLVNAITYEVYAGNVAVSGTATPNSTVQVELDNVLVSTVAANGSGAWSTVVSCEAGQHTIRARQVAEPQTFPYSNVVNVTGSMPANKQFAQVGTAFDYWTTPAVPNTGWFYEFQGGDLTAFDPATSTVEYQDGTGWHTLSALPWADLNGSGTNLMGVVSDWSTANTLEVYFSPTINVPPTAFRITTSDGVFNVGPAGFVPIVAAPASGLDTNTVVNAPNGNSGLGAANAASMADMEVASPASYSATFSGDDSGLTVDKPAEITFINSHHLQVELQYNSDGSNIPWVKSGGQFVCSSLFVIMTRPV